MAEKMLVTQALDERDLLVKKIGDKIAKASFTDVKKHNEENEQKEKNEQEEENVQKDNAKNEDNTQDEENKPINVSL